MIDDPSREVGWENSGKSIVIVFQAASEATPFLNLRFSRHDFAIRKLNSDVKSSPSAFHLASL
jgi:hypothetical protein